MIGIGISTREIPDHPELHPHLLFDSLDETAIADIRRRLATGAKCVVVQVVERPEEIWVRAVPAEGYGCHSYSP